MVKCVVHNCTNNSINKRPGISYHVIPKQKVLREKWLKAIGLPHLKPSRSSLICSVHFNEMDINRTLNVVRLKDDALPTLQLPNNPPRNPLQEIQQNVQSDINSPSTSTVEPGKTVIASAADIIIMKDKTLSTRRPSRAENMLIKKLKRRNYLLAKKLKSFGQKIRRQTKRISNMKSLLGDLLKKEIINNESYNILNECSGPRELLERQILKSKHMSKPKTYSPELRTFALTLNFLSPKAYDFVRSTYNSCLPHPRTLCKWYENVDAEPGFTKEAFETLKNVSEGSIHPIYCSLIIDEMSIRKSLEWDT